jgi:peptidoglycan/xylan/chitin deacetylase (PgdA/CDA1 family)
MEAAHQGEVPPRAVALTFDDGYRESLSTAVPLLFEWGIPATHFVLTGPLEHPREPWWDTLARLLLLGGDASAPRLEVELDGAVEVLPTATALERAAAHRRIAEVLLRGTLEVREAALASLARWCGGALPPPRPEHRLLVADELRGVEELPGQRIECHGAEHAFLPAEPAAVRHREIVASKARLEALLGRPVDAFAYAHGGHDDAVVETVRAGGFRLAVTVDPGSVAAGADPLRLPRLLADGLSVEELRRRLRELLPGAALAPAEPTATAPGSRP